MSIDGFLSEDALSVLLSGVTERATEVGMQAESEATLQNPMGSSCLISNILGVLEMFSCPTSGARLEASSFNHYHTFAGHRF